MELFSKSIYITHSSGKEPIENILEGKKKTWKVIRQTVAWTLWLAGLCQTDSCQQNCCVCELRCTAVFPKTNGE